MNGPDRYRTLVGRATEAADGDSLGCLEGVDPVTGLPVLIYDFEGDPLALPGDIESMNIPQILWSSSEEGRGRIVAALSPGWQRLGEDSGPLTLERLLDAARAIRDAADAGVAHGDLGPRRLLLVEGRLLVEGYGVPWQPPADSPYRASEVSDVATLAGDVYSLAKVVESLGLSARDQTVSAVLEQCTAEDPLQRPNPEELYLALETLVGQQRKAETRRVAAPGSGTAGAAPGAADEQTSESSEPSTAEEPPPVRAPQPSQTRTSGSTHDAEPRSVSAARASADGPPARPTPVAATPGPAPAQQTREKRIRLSLLGALMAAVIIFALLALYGPRGTAPLAPEPLQDIVYVVEVEVVPDDLPPVAIHLVRAPEGSSLTRSDTIGTAPRHLALDRAGTWAFQGSLDGRTSDVVEIEVPQERMVTLVMPPAQAR